MIRRALKTLGYLVAALLTGSRLPEEGEAAVLMYHAIDRSGWRLAVTPEVFERQMRYLSKRRVPVPLADVVALAKGEKELAKGSVTVTIDDGYADLVPTVLPVLERYRIPAALFLTTDLTAKTNSRGTPRISPDDLLTLQKSGLVTIESHGRTHAHLPKLDAAQVEAELIGAKQDMERELGVSPAYFAYPYGDRSAEVEAAVPRAGYEAAFAITEGFVRKGSNILRLPRIQVDATMNTILFNLRLTPALARYRSIANFIRHGHVSI